MKCAITILLVIILSLHPVKVSNASTRSDADKMLKYYQQKNIPLAKKYCKKLPKKAEPNFKQLSEKEKRAYKKIVRKYKNKYENPSYSGFEWHYYFHGYYLADIDGDNKAELLINHGPDPHDSKLTVYQYRKGKAEKTAEIPTSGYTTYYAYPGHAKVIERIGIQGHESISVISLHKKQLKQVSYGSRVVKGGLFPLRQGLYNHIKSKETGKYQYQYWIDFGDL